MRFMLGFVTGAILFAIAATGQQYFFYQEAVDCLSKVELNLEN